MPTDVLENTRLKACRAVDNLDMASEPAFDRMAQLAADIFGTPIVLISLTGGGRQRFMSCVGLSAGGTAPDMTFCDIAMGQDEVVIVADTAEDSRFAGAPDIRFYAGAPLHDGGIPVGTLSIIDRVPRPDFDAGAAKMLQNLAATVSEILTMRRDAADAATSQARNEARQTVELMEDVAGVGRWSYDVASGIVTWSDQVFRILGLPIAGQAPPFADIMSYYHPDDRPILADLVERAANTGQGFDREARIRRADGQWRSVQAKAVCLRDPNGRVTTISGVFQDITDYRNTSVKLEASERRYRLLAENMPGMIGYWDRDMRCRFANNAYLEWFGRRPEDLLGISMKDLMGEELFALNEGHIRGALAGEKQTFERTLTKPSGEVGYTLAQYVPDHDERGRVRGFYVLVTDITNLKLKELALADSNTQLIAARQQAEAAGEIKSQFLATMSHEIRTPLTTILGYANLLSDTENLPEEAGAFVKRIGKAGRALLDLVNDVLDVSRLESGQVALDPQATHVRNLSQDIIDQFQPAAKARGLRLSLDYDAQLPDWLTVDETRLTQVLNNLIGNACKFTVQGGVTVTLRATGAAGAEQLSVEVTDTGPGLSEEQSSQLFQRFHQVDRGINRKHGGTGLGLAICSEIVKLMHGRIGVRSQPGGGSTFWFDIPLAIAAPSAPENDLRPADAGDHAWNVLLVDDHAANRRMIKALILPFAAHVEQAVNGAEAIAACMKSRFDLVIMDIQMPDMDGVTTTRTLRAQCPLNADTPVIALTATNKNRLLDDGAEGLFAQILAKPIDPRKLYSALATVVRDDNPVRQGD